MSERLQIPDKIRDILQEPNWYDHLGRIKGSLLLGALAVRNVVKVVNLPGKPADRAKHLLLRVVSQLLREEAVALGQAGPDWDAERQAIDMVVVHHTSRRTPISLDDLNALHLLNLYVPKYRNPGAEASIIGGMPIYSGHADSEGRQVFYGYHWLVRQDGKRERLLPDETIGWHAGNWGVNTRSVAVCFEGDFTEASPSGQALDSAAALVAEQYPTVSSRRILGHNAIVQTICPGNEFSVWGAELSALVEAYRS